MSRARHLHKSSGYSRIVQYRNGYRIQVLVAMITEEVISFNTLERPKRETGMTWWAHRTLWHQWLIAFWGPMRTMKSTLHRMETCRSQINHHRSLLGTYYQAIPLLTFNPYNNLSRYKYSNMLFVRYTVLRKWILYLCHCIVDQSSHIAIVMSSIRNYSSGIW